MQFSNGLTVENGGFNTAVDGGKGLLGNCEKFKPIKTPRRFFG